MANEPTLTPYCRYQFCFLLRYSNGITAANITSCPSSTPRLNDRIDNNLCSLANPSSANTLANPIPCSKPKAKVIQPNLRINGQILFNAVNSTDSAMPNSTHLLLWAPHPKAVAVSVMECARVNAVTTHDLL
jgi:hypothetical protein